MDHDGDRAALELLIHGFKVSRMIRLVADLAIADRVAPAGASRIADLAAACEVSAEPLKRVLRALATFGIFRIEAGDAIAHTPRSRLLRTDTPRSLHYGARFLTAQASWRAWEMLDAALQDKVPHEVAWGTGRFAYLRDHPDEARLFDTYMANGPEDRHDAVAKAYDFSQASLIADIGGGNGEALRRILACHPTVRGLVFDHTDVVAAIPADQRAEGRIATQGGSFLDAVPAGADLYLLAHVLHDWNDERALAILRSCRAAMKPQARLLIVEVILETDPSQARQKDYLMDMQMMAMFGSARERTAAEFGDLLAAADLQIASVIPTAASVSILEAIPTQ